MKNKLENLELKLFQTRKENAEKLDKIETEFKKQYSDFLDLLDFQDNIWFKRYLNVYFQLGKIDNPSKNNNEIFFNAFLKSIEILPINTDKKDILKNKVLKILRVNNSKISDISEQFIKNSDLHKNYNFPILEWLNNHWVLDKNDLINISLKYKKTKNFLESIKILDLNKIEIIKSNYFELNNTWIEKRQENFEIDFKKEINNSKLLKVYPKVLKFIWKNYFRLKLKNKVESKKDRLRRLYKIAFLKLYRLKYSWIDIDKIIERINTIDDFDEFINLIIKYFEVLKQNPNLQKDFIISEDIDEVNAIWEEAEENKQKILFSEKNTIKVNELLENTEKKLTKNELEDLLWEDVDLIWNEFRNRISINAWILNKNNNISNEDWEDEELNEDIDIEEYYEDLKWEYEQLEKRKSKSFSKWDYEQLDKINNELLDLMIKLEKIQKILWVNNEE